jgi:hypothetical protein
MNLSDQGRFLEVLKRQKRHKLSTMPLFSGGLEERAPLKLSWVNRLCGGARRAFLWPVSPRRSGGRLCRAVGGDASPESVHEVDDVLA